MGKYILLEQPAVRSRTKASLKIISVVLFLALTVLLSHIRVPLPATPVPLTLQVLAVFLAGYFLSPRLAVACMAIYLMAGFAGLPVFSGGSGGTLSLAGPTAGYLIGFIPAAWVISSLTEKKISPWLNIALTVFSGIAIIYSFGIAHLLTYMKLATGLGFNTLFMPVLSMGVYPFILIDSAKAILAASLFYGLARRTKLI